MEMKRFIREVGLEQMMPSNHSPRSIFYLLDLSLEEVREIVARGGKDEQGNAVFGMGAVSQLDDVYGSMTESQRIKLRADFEELQSYGRLIFPGHEESK